MMSQSVEIERKNTDFSPWRLSVAPMLAWTDKHCRYLHRQLTRHTRLYTEMINAGALLYGEPRRHLRHDACEHPLALQLGGSDWAELARAARMGQDWGYNEVNLNCGCPSERVQNGAFGACLMAEPKLVADCVKAMVDAVDVPVTVKHRIGIDRIESYDFVRDFVGTVADAGCQVFIVHARNAWLKGLSPKENRDIPPLRYDIVHRLKREFAHLTIVINGGIGDNAQIAEQLQHVDGVMVGRAAYHQPSLMRDWDARFWGKAEGLRSADEIEAEMVRYMARELAEDGTPWSAIARHMLGLHHGRRGARLWRQVWSDHRLKSLPAAEVAARAAQSLQEAALTP